MPKFEACFEKLTAFQYRQRYQEGYNGHGLIIMSYRISSFQYRQRYQEGYNCSADAGGGVLPVVSIPTTVSGGLQYSNGVVLNVTPIVSIPTTVSGGLQFLDGAKEV